MVLLNKVVKPSIHFSRSLYHSRSDHNPLGLGLSIPSSFQMMMMVFVLLLLLSGDIETNPGPVGNKLTSDDLGCILEEVLDVSAQWYNLGLQLKLGTGTLDSINKQFHDPKDQLRETLKTWLTTCSNTSWNDLTDALRSQSVGATQLAGQLEKKYCPVEGTDVNKEVLTKDEITISEVSLAATCTNSDMHNPNTILESCSDSTSSPVSEPVQKKPRLDLDTKPEHNYSTSPPPTESFEEKLQPDIDTEHSGSSTRPTPSEKPGNSPFGCGCGKCTFFSFIEKGCQTPIPSASSFPYLDHSGLTHEQQQKLEERLQYETQEIILRFHKLVSATIKSFQKRSVPPDELVSHVMQALGAFDPVWKKPVFTDYQEQIKAAETIPKVFLILNDYFSFFNYHIIEHIIEELGTEEDKAELQRYKEDFKQYAKRRIFECPPEFGLVSDADHANIIVKVNLQFDKYTVEETKGLCHQLSKILCVSFGILRLCRVDKGCFQLMFQVPSFVQQEIFPLSRKQENTLKAIGVIKLTCGDYQFLKDDPSGVDKKHQHDHDDDSGRGTLTETKSTTVFEDHLEKKMEKVDYEQKVEDLVETASSHKSGSGLELHNAVAQGNLETVRILVEKKHCNPMQRDWNDFTAIDMTAIVGNVQALKYFVTECNCNPACPGPLGLTPLHLASQNGHLEMVKYLVIEQQIDPLCEDEYKTTPLHRACAGGHQAVVKFLISEHETYSPTNEFVSNLNSIWNNTPLHVAVTKGHLHIAQFFISDKNCDPNIPGSHGRTLLHCAAEFGHLHIVKYLTDEQACNPSCLDTHKYTPLHCAAKEGHINIVKFLTVEKHCDPMCKDYEQNTPLHMAARNGYIDTVNFLCTLKRYAPIAAHMNNLMNKVNITPLHDAIGMGHLDIVKLFICDQKCDPNIPGGENGGPSLHCAADSGHLHIVKYLIDEQGCNTSCLDDLKQTPLHYAAKAGHLDIVKFLTVEKHCDPMCKDSYHDTPLYKAAGNGHLDIVQFLISDQKCDPNVPCWLGSTALHYAADSGHLHIVKHLIDVQGCNPSCLSQKDKYTPLHCAAMKGHIDIVKFLTVEKHCDPTCKDVVQNTPLHMASQNGHTDTVKFLCTLKEYTPISELMNNLRNSLNSTPLHNAAGFGHLDIVHFLISDLKCDPNTAGGQIGLTVLHCAAQRGHLHIVKYLINEQGCNPLCLDECKNTPLHWAAMEGHVDVVKFFTVEKHCDPTCRGYKQCTPLHLAAVGGHISIVKFLAEKKHCDPLSKDGDNNNVLHIAIMFRHFEIIKFLIEKLECPPDTIGGQYNITPLLMAQCLNHSDIAQYLQKHSVIPYIYTAMDMLKQLGKLK